MGGAEVLRAARQTAKLAERLRIGMRRGLEGQRNAYRAAARGLPKLQDLVALPRQRFDAAAARLGRGLMTASAVHARRLARIAPRLQTQLLLNRVERARQRLDQASDRKTGALGRYAVNLRMRHELLALRLAPRLVTDRIERWRNRLDNEAKLLTSLSYQSVLRRGFALVRDTDGRAIRSAAAITAGQRLHVEFGDGHVAADAVGDGSAAKAPRPQSASTPPAKPRALLKRSDGGSGPQGSLF